jgi:hypothetical protein
MEGDSSNITVVQRVTHTLGGWPGALPYKKAILNH